ncbi:MAG: DNA repair protein RadA [Candidatus Kerfeldbacteria bacterium]|jgi:DNA repair protein RadA/Sms
MSKGQQIIHTCNKCDAQYPKWQGRCTECGEWGSLGEQSIIKKTKNISNNKSESAELEVLAEVDIKNEHRLKSGIYEFDRVLGGGIVSGSLILLGGDPGVGKSTLALQAGGNLATGDKQVLYVSGEESSAQVKIRFTRLGLSTTNLKFIGETSLDTILATIEKHDPDLVIIDSIQTLNYSEIESEAGSISQVKAVTAKLAEIAKDKKIPIILIGHVTKDGSVAGPRTLEHLVDVVLYLEGDRYHAFRILRAVKNRFGSTSEVGVFDMQSGGLKEVTNPSKIFLSDRKTDSPGSVVTAVVEGSRSFLVEIQALVTRTAFGYPQRRANGIDINRLQMLIAVLIKKAGLFLGNQDIHVNVAGGFKISEPSVDLAVCLAIASAFKNKLISKTTATFGEVGLGGELRTVSQVDKRMEELKKMGFKKIVMPKTKLNIKVDNINIITSDTISEIIKDYIV